MKLALVALIAVVPVALTLFSAVLAAPGAQKSSVWDGIYTEAQAVRGSGLYSTDCARCHGPDLKGGEMAPGIAGGDFIWAWNGLSVGELFERLRTTMPLDGPDRVSRQEKTDILAFMLKMNGFPAGEMELADRTELLDAIIFEAARP